MSYLWRSHTPGDKKVERLIPQGFELIVSKNIAKGAIAIDAQFSLVFVNYECGKRNRLNNLCPMNFPSLLSLKKLMNSPIRKQWGASISFGLNTQNSAFEVSKRRQWCF